MSGITSAGYFLIMTLFSALTFILWARILIRYVAVSPFHPFSQLIYRLTTPMVAPIQAHIMRSYGTRGLYDLTSLAVLFIVELIKFTLMSAVFLDGSIGTMSIILASVCDMIIQPCDILFYAIIVRTILSWLHTDWQNPMVKLIVMVTEPLLRRIRNMLPNMAMIDFSPLVAILALNVISVICRSLLPL